MKTFSVIAVGVLLPLAVACSQKQPPSDLEAVLEGSDAVNVESNTESLSMSLLGGSQGSVGLQSASSPAGSIVLYDNVGEIAETYFQPAGCLVVTDMPASHEATYAFSNCSGPYGLVHITGNVVVDYDVSSGTELHLSYTGKNLQINSSTVNWTATADVTVSGSTYTVQWAGQFSGTTGAGRSFSRTNTKTYTWDTSSQCLTANGTSNGTVTGDDLQTDVIGYARCVAECPASGSEITITDESTSRTYDLKYGTDSATYTGPSGTVITFTPPCAY